jgi:hypothetical protein
MPDNLATTKLDIHFDYFALKLIVRSSVIWLLPLFEGLPLTQYQFSAILKKSLSVLRIENADIRSHSFRTLNWYRHFKEMVG